MQSQKSGLLQIGVSLVVLGVAINLAIMLGHMLRPFAGIAIVIGVILAIIGLVTPRRY